MFQKVSVVVPIYNVEKYLKRCIESILHQTYSNIEIILVNDGSPDQCGKIAEDYAKSDTRIKVIHKKNGGLSDARNEGMSCVTGDFSMFVDSDDWLDRNMIEELINASNKYKAEVVQSAFYYAYEDHLLFDQRHFKVQDSPTILDREALMSELVKNERVKNFAWGKLIRTSILEGIQFKKGVLFEDVFWAHKVMHRVEKFVLINEPLYYYRQRNDSIVATYTPKNLDILEGLMERHHFLEMHYQNLIDESYKMILKTCLSHYKLLMMNRKIDKSGSYRKRVAGYIKSHSEQLKKAVSHDPTLNTQLKMFLLNPYLNLLLDATKKFFRLLEIIPQPTGLQRVMLTNKK